MTELSRRDVRRIIEAARDFLLWAADVGRPPSPHLAAYIGPTFEGRYVFEGPCDVCGGLIRLEMPGSAGIDTWHLHGGRWGTWAWHDGPIPDCRRYMSRIEMVWSEKDAARASLLGMFVSRFKTN